MMKKLLSVLLSILMIFMVFGTSAVFANEDETEILGPGAEDTTLPEVAEGCNRYFFMMPEDWYNEYTDTAGIYWWENTGACDSWPGYKAHKADAENVYYYDVPKDVWTIIWNNYVDGKNDPSADIFQNVRKTGNVGAEYYEPGENEHYPDGLSSFDGMIYVVDPEPDFSTLEPTITGDWYYYYGNGEYGTLPEVTEGCNRYFFYQPESWKCEYSTTVGVYWWEGTDAQAYWPGVEARKADAENVYYYDVPKDVEYIIWNNYVQYSPDLVVGPEYAATRQTHEVYVGEYMIFDEMCDYVGMGNHDGDIYVTREKCFCDDYPECQKSSGMFYTYNGKGEYRGVFPDGEIKTSTEPVIDNHGGYQRPYVKGYNRFFFYMPDEWCTDCSSVPGAYWNTETSSSDGYPGTPMKPPDIEGMYYIDIPASVDEFYFTNLVDGGTDIYAPIFAQEIKAHSRPYYADDSFLLEECNGMVFVVNHAWYDYSEYDGKLIFEGMWFEYYGFGEYGYLGGKYGLSDVYTNKSFNDYYFNPIVHPYFIGDTDGDGIVSVKDATAIQKHLADIKSCNVIEGDVDNNGLNIKDATAIQKYVAGIEVDAPISTIQYR